MGDQVEFLLCFDGTDYVAECENGVEFFADDGIIESVSELPTGESVYTISFVSEEGDNPVTIFVEGVIAENINSRLNPSQEAEEEDEAEEEEEGQSFSDKVVSEIGFTPMIAFISIPIWILGIIFFIRQIMEVGFNRRLQVRIPLINETLFVLIAVLQGLLVIFSHESPDEPSAPRRWVSENITSHKLLFEMFTFAISGLAIYIIIKYRGTPFKTNRDRGTGRTMTQAAAAAAASTGP